MDNNYKFDEINPVPVDSIKVNPMFDGPDDEDEEQNQVSHYRSDFDSDMSYREENREYEEDEEDVDYDSEDDGEDTSDDSDTDEEISDEEAGEEVNINTLVKSGSRYAAGYQLIGKRPNDSRIRRKGLFKREGSFVMRFVDKTVAKIYDMTKNGILGNFFTSYDRLEEKTASSAVISTPSKIVSFFKKRKAPKINEKIVFDDITGEEVAKIREKTKKQTSVLKKTVAVFEKSVILNFIGRFLSTLLYLPVATYGALLLSTGITTILVQAAKVFWLAEAINTAALLLGVSYTLIAVMTIFTGDITLVRYLCESKMGSFMLVSVFGLFKKNIDTERKVPKYRLLAFLLGVGIGLPALDVFISIVLIVVALGIAHNPESGVVILSFLLPFTAVFSSGQKYFYLLILYVTLVWIIKLARGQRRAKFSALDGLILMFAGFVLLTAFVSVDRSEALYHALNLIMPIMGYFLVSNLLSSRVWISRGVGAMLISGFVVSAYGIYQWAVHAINNSWRFDKLLDGNINSVFFTTEVLSVYLIVIFCFALSGLSSKNSRGIRLLSASIILPIVVCIALTMDVYAWTVLVISVMIYALIKSKKSAASILGVFAIILFVLYLVSDILPNYFMMLTGDSLSGNIEVIHVSAKMAGKYLLTGIGLGETVFENIYKSLSQTGSVSASNGGNLLFEMLIRFGIVGILFLVSVIVLVYRQAFSTYKVAAVRRFASVYSVAALTAFTALIMVSGMNYIWKDFYMAYMFWTLIGLVSASRSIADFDNATLMKGDGLDIKLPISTFRKKVKNR